MGVVSGRFFSLLFGVFFSLFAHAEICDGPLTMLAGRNIPLRRTLGIEVEATISHKVSYTDVQATIVDVLSKIPGVKNIKFFSQMPHIGGWFEPIDLRHYHVTYELDGKTHHYVVSHDISINPPVGRRGIEIRSPILSTGIDVGIFDSVMKAITQKHGIEANPLSGGVHVHVGAQDFNPGQVLLASRLFSRMEQELLESFRVPDSRKQYVQPISERLLAITESELPLLEMRDLIARSDGRKRALNLQSLKKFGTLEFRLFNSTVDVESIFFMADFSLRFVDTVKEGNPEVLRILERPVEASKVLPDLLKAMGLDAQDARAKILASAVRDMEAALDKKYYYLSEKQKLMFKQAAILAPLLSATAYLFLKPLWGSDDGDDEDEKKKGMPPAQP